MGEKKQARKKVFQYGGKGRLKNKGKNRNCTEK
jgi:hypothetical protein